MSEATDYSKTVRLPQTEFPMRAGLAQSEPKRVEQWLAQGAYQKLRQERAGKPKWVLHDGPPFANGDIHMGHALNKISKDVWVRYQTLLGKDAPYVPGWDCHGMPIEFKVSKDLKGQKVTPFELRKLCKAEALKFVERQKGQFQRLGVWGEWDNPYLTLAPEFEAGQLDAYWALIQKKQVYRDLKPVHWSWATQTALAEAELEYKDKTSTQVYVKYPLSKDSAAQLGAKLPAFAVIWTTTPWTLPASLAITANEKFDYALYEVDGEQWLLNTGLAGPLFEKLGKKPLLGWQGKGAELESLQARHPFIAERSIRFCLAPYVTADAGTGLVHTAPGHGVEDYVTGVRYGLPILCPVDERGCYNDDWAPMKGLRVTDPKTDEAILELLRAQGRLIHSEKFQHSYPHDWRSKEPVIFRATKQWFMSLSANGLREQVVSETDKVKWLNPWGAERFRNMMKDRADWCISRQRFWGVPIYMFYCEEHGHEFFDEAAYKKVRAIVEKEGGDAWFDPARGIEDFLPGGAQCPECGGTRFRKETDTLDVWFDSGSSHMSVLRGRASQSFPADLYLEGSDQYRGWFQSSMLVSVGVSGQAPYKSVLSTGWVLDPQGRAMHKSLGNVVDPLKVMETSGADILRLWVASEDATADLSVGDNILKTVSDNYRRLRNTFRWLLGSLDGFEPAKDALALEQLQPLDRWLLARLSQVIEQVSASMDAYELHKAFSHLTNFCAGELSSLVFDVHKDTLYTLGGRDPKRLSAQTALYEVLKALLPLSAPVLAFTAEEAWELMPASFKGGVSSVHFSAWPQARPDWRQAELEEELGQLVDLVRPHVSKRLEEARAAKLIGHPYDAAVTLSVRSKKILRVLKKHEALLPQLFIVSEVRLGQAAPQDGIHMAVDEVTVEASAHEKCPRCWRRPASGASAQGPLCGRCEEALKA